MADPTEHVHSRAAYEMMDEFLIGQLGGSEKIVSEDWVPDPNFHPEDTDTLADFQRSKFIDLQKPLLAQVWKGGFSKEFYLEQVHQPRHVKVSARLFGSDLLEPLTRTKWWVVPMIWLPITVFLGVLSLAQFNDRYVPGRSALWRLSRGFVQADTPCLTLDLILQLDRLSGPPHPPRLPLVQLLLLNNPSNPQKLARLVNPNSPGRLHILLRPRLCRMDDPRIHPPSVLVPPGLLPAG
jgi:hypothetical protein